MKARILLAALYAAVSAPLSAHAQAGVSPAAEAPKEDIVRVALETDAGRIVLALDRGKAPITTANFLRYVESGRLEGESFYRAMAYPGGGLIQGGGHQLLGQAFPGNRA